MAISFFSKQGIILSTVIVVLAVAYRLQQPLVDVESASETETFCYKSVKLNHKEKTSAHCFSTRNGLFQKVWTLDGDAEENSEAEVREGYAMPGLWDGHGHLLQYGEFLHSVDLFGSDSLDEARRRVKEYLKTHPEAGTKEHWLRGVGWDQTLLGSMPSADDLTQDADLKDLYIMLDRIDVHCTWVSQPVLNVLPDLPDHVPGGEIVRDPGLGVFCDNAMDIVTAKWPRRDSMATAETIKTAMKALNEVGIVGMHDAGVIPETLSLFADLADTDDWTLRVYAMLECEKRNTFCPDEAVKIYRSDHKLTVQSVKLFADGALGSWGSAMLEPYTDRPATSGSLLINATDLVHVTELWASAGFQVNIHAIGDLANRNAIDAFEAALKTTCPDFISLSECQSRTRFRIEHAQIIHPKDQARLHELGIIPSIQPTHATSDMTYAEDRLGSERASIEAYRMQTFLKMGIIPVLGSDFPVEPPNPFHGVYAAVTRKSPRTGRGANGAEDGWHMQEALDLDDALWGFTGGAAYGAFLEDKAGTIAEGRFADWIVIDEDITKMDIEHLRSLRVRETWIGGKRVYLRD